MTNPRALDCTATAVTSLCGRQAGGVPATPPAFSIRDEIIPLLPKLRLNARRLTRNREWEDLLQDTITRALAAEDQYRPGTNLIRWLFTIMRNIRINQFRHLGRVEYRAPNCDLFMTVQAASAREARDELIDAQKRFDNLPEWARGIIDSSMRHDCHYIDMAAELDMPVGTVKSRLNRARQMMAGKVRW